MSDDILDQAAQTERGMGARQRRTRWVLWVQWVLVNAAVVFVALAIPGWALGLVPDGWVALPLIGMGVACVALGQWLVLRLRLARAGWWVLVTPVGLVLGGIAAVFALGLEYVYYWPLSVFLPLVIFLVGTPVGLLQWLVLRRQVRRALWWLPATLVAIGTGCLAFWLVSLGTGNLAAALNRAVAGAVYGAITGAALVLLLPHSAQTGD